ncbi:MAG: hypothetical protein R3290_02210 [Acidimicrobiia bacterium]|nr:hypothetical protein [Acidimicrobiia bacterium]
MIQEIIASLREVAVLMTAGLAAVALGTAVQRMVVLGRSRRRAE